MRKERSKIDRRDFLKTMGAAGVGSVFAAAIGKAGTTGPNVPAETKQPGFPQVPTRKLGKTGADVPMLSFGAMFDITANRVILHNCLKWGVYYWDTARSYAGGNSEIGISQYLAKNPEARKKIFLVTKASGAGKEPTPQAIVKKVEELLDESLKTMNTDYIDLYYGIHGLKDPAQLDEPLKKWAEDAKKRKLIRYFGFTTHTNMADCLQAAAKLDWIDAIMLKYNYRLMQDAKMQAAIDACYQKGIGLVAMKTQALRRTEEVEDADEKLLEHFHKQGFTAGQAKIKAVLDDGKIATACVGMQTVSHLTENVGAVLDKSKLSRADKDALAEYARSTCNGFCAGCANICESAISADMPYISDIMRYLMYHNSYGQKQMARELFAQIPAEARQRLLNIDYTIAEERCPQRIPIAQAVAEAFGKLA